MTHALITAIWCLIFLFTNIHPTFYALPAIWYMGREFTQAEYRIIESKYDHKRANMPWYGGFMPEAWTIKGVLDWVLPSLVALIFFLLKTYVHFDLLKFIGK